MILVVSATRTAEVSFSPLRELEEEACLELDEVVAIPEELLDNFFVDELDDAASEELDSSTALFSSPSGPELLASSPQAVKNKVTADAKNAGKKLLEII